MSTQARRPHPSVIEARMMAAADRANERIRTCHERVACPYCTAPVGERCRRGRYGYHPYSEPLKHPHRHRWAQETPAR